MAVRYEPDPKHYELIARSLHLEAGTLALTPGMKPNKPEESTFKGDEHAIDGPVMDITGRISIASAGPDGEVTITDSDRTYTQKEPNLLKTLWQ